MKQEIFVYEDKFKIEKHKFMRSNGGNKEQGFSTAMTEKKYNRSRR